MPLNATAMVALFQARLEALRLMHRPLLQMRTPQPSATKRRHALLACACMILPPFLHIHVTPQGIHHHPHSAACWCWGLTRPHCLQHQWHAQ